MLGFPVLNFLDHYSGPINSDTKMGAAKVHFDHDTQTLYARPESRHRAGTVQGRRNATTNRVPTRGPSQPAAQVESSGTGRSAQSVHRRRTGQAGGGKRTPAPTGRTLRRDRSAHHPVSLAQKKIWPRTWPALNAWRCWN